LNDLPLELFKADLTLPDSLSGIADNVDTVFHCAGILGKWGSDETLIEQTNVQGSLNLLKCFKDKKIQRFIYLSAGGVTGPVADGIANETTICLPATNYERSKLVAEQSLLQYAHQHHIPLLIVRPTFTYGPSDHHKLPLFQAIKKNRFAYIGNGLSLISPVYIDDLINGILLALENGRVGETYIISGTNPVTKKELIETIADALNVKQPQIKIPYRLAWMIASILEGIAPYFNNFQPIITRSKVMMMGDNFGYSCQKAQSELNYQAKVSLRSGIAKTVAEYRQRGLL
jgi:nucleoside-diphosphate-sugar epimerase